AGVDEVLRWRPVAIERGLELVEARSAVDLEERFDGEVGLGRGRPAQGEYRSVLEPRVDIAEDRAVARRSNVEPDVADPGHLDRLVPNLERDRAALEDVVAGV